MTQRLGLLLAVALTACTRPVAEPVTPAPAPAATPAPTAPAAQQPAATPAPAAAAPAPAPAAAAPAPSAPTPGAAQPAGQDTPRPPAIRAAPQATTLDTTSAGRAAVDSAESEEAFLDTLRATRADTTLPVATPVAREEVRSEAAELLGRPTWDIDVETHADHERVQYWMNFFSGRARSHFERYLERQPRFDSIIRTRLAAAGLPQDMIYLAMIESGFNQTARSRAGAVGLWQFMPETGRRYGLQLDAWVDERRDPYLSTDAAIRFLSELNNRFGSMWLAAAAYNGGPGRVIRGLARGDFGALNGDAVYFAMTENNRYFRPETRDYVPKLIAAALLGKQPERWGFVRRDPWEPLVYDSIEITDAVGLDVLARLADAAVTDMEEMNARFYRGVTPPGRTVWVRVPVGSGDSVLARLARLPARERVTLLYHTVARGETLSRISRRYGVSVNDLKSANRLRSSRIQRGQRLLIPNAGRGLRAAVAEPPRATAATREVAPARREEPQANMRIHVVRQGETLWSISQQFGVSVTALMSANRLTRRSVIHPGQRLRVPR